MVFNRIDFTVATVFVPYQPHNGYGCVPYRLHNGYGLRTVSASRWLRFMHRIDFMMVLVFDCINIHKSLQSLHRNHLFFS
ncbi:hypothetical protein LOAG_09483 [Loa loa]|uniref:Uncharacterized protein n=1 Tax=Loa loa TaxID=7209 RepID=A0A1S0TSC7_LOALO|nr:hypothetical protein LOAG_09483 [Loa loa]EFO19013.2 hypothetical protein LOAG_09483 [Loa loa]